MATRGAPYSTTSATAAATTANLSRTVSRYLADFERIVSESDARDPSGRLSHGQLISDTGRVYLFLAHASGRLG